MMVVLDNNLGTRPSKRPKYIVQVMTEKTEEGFSLSPLRMLKAIRILKKYPRPRHGLHMYDEIVARVEDEREGMFFVFYSPNGNKFECFHRIKFNEAIKMSGQALMEEAIRRRYLVEADRANRNAAIMAEINARESWIPQCDL